MKDISIGIYHKDHQYGKRLMEYLNHQKDFPMTASFTSDEEMFFKETAGCIWQQMARLTR